VAQPAAKLGDTVTGTDTHIVMVPSPGGPVPTPGPHPFSGTITGGCSPNVVVDGQPAAVVGATATNTAPHLPIPPAGTFQVPPTNQGTVSGPGSATVLINGTPAARIGDQVMTCNDPAPAPTSVINGTSTVLIG
jgi:uncharacterized Zn-binding protein involved in type VI secretion